MEVSKRIPSSRAAAGKNKMHNNKPELKIISSLRSWIGFDPIQWGHARIMGHWLAGVASQQCHQTVIAQYIHLQAISVQQHPPQIQGSKLTC
jgi:hypothetical protein